MNDEEVHVDRVLEIAEISHARASRRTENHYGVAQRHGGLTLPAHLDRAAYGWVKPVMSGEATPEEAIPGFGGVPPAHAASRR